MAGLDLKENERIDWFRIVVDLRQVDITPKAINKELNIPKSTLTGWTSENANPRFEVGMRLIRFWAEKCGKNIEDAPVYDPFKPYPIPPPAARAPVKVVEKPHPTPQHTPKQKKEEMQLQLGF